MNTENLIPVDFDDLADWIVSMNCLFSPAELHGAIVGGICGAMRLSKSEWAAFGLAVMGIDERVDQNQQQSATQVVGGLANDQLNQLQGSELNFMPMLPDDDVDLTQRTEAVSQWCKGFLGGFAEAQVYRQRNAGTPDSNLRLEGDQLPDNVAEALRDIAAISQASLTVDDDDAAGDLAFETDILPEFIGDEMVLEEGEYGSDSDAESDERDFTEIVEYLRLAALTVFTEYGWIEVARPRSEQAQDNNTLH